MSVSVADNATRHLQNSLHKNSYNDAWRIFVNSSSLLPKTEKHIVSPNSIDPYENNFDLDRASLVVSEAFANEGPTLKRFRPRAKGSASPINKRTSHITVVVTEK